MGAGKGWCQEKAIIRDTIWYTVSSGDNLSIIAGKYNITVDSLCIWNNISDPNSIKQGEKLIVAFKEPRESEILDNKENTGWQKKEDEPENNHDKPTWWVLGIGSILFAFCIFIRIPKYSDNKWMIINAIKNNDIIWNWLFTISFILICCAWSEWVAAAGIIIWLLFIQKYNSVSILLFPKGEKQTELTTPPQSTPKKNEDKSDNKTESSPRRKPEDKSAKKNDFGEELHWTIDNEPVSVNKDGQIKDISTSQIFYAGTIIDGILYRIKAEPNEDTFFELHRIGKKKAELKLYPQAERKILSNTSYIDGCDYQCIRSRSKINIRNNGEAELREDGKWHVSKKINILID